MNIKEATEKAAEHIERLITTWHDGDSEVPLIEFLRWTEEEYMKYVVENTLPQREIDLWYQLELG